MPAITSARAGSLAIGELSRLTGVHIETIRYYERLGMLAVPSRTAGGRRLYEHGHVRALAFIRRARELGFALEEIRALVELSGSEPASCAEVRKIASHHLEDVSSPT
jgi:MerR family transcriptional regulator, mercuric resistance operon regulatory protein